MTKAGVPFLRRGVERCVARMKKERSNCKNAEASLRLCFQAGPKQLTDWPFDYARASN
jgi:hypothetical protein